MAKFVLRLNKLRTDHSELNNISSLRSRAEDTQIVNMRYHQNYGFSRRRALLAQLSTQDDDSANLISRLKRLGLARDPNKFRPRSTPGVVELSHFYPYRRRLMWQLKLHHHINSKPVSLASPKEGLKLRTLTIRRYLYNQWHAYIRLQLERYLSKHTHARVYVSLHNALRAIHSHTSVIRKQNSCFFSELEPKRLGIVRSAKVWGWSFYQMQIISLSIILLLTIPNSHSLVLLILKHLLQKNRKHAAVVKFFTGQLNSAIEKLDESDKLVVSYRLYLAGRIGGGLRKKRLNYINNPILYPLRISIPIQAAQTVAVTKYGSIGIKFWFQVFPDSQRLFDQLPCKPSDKLRV